MSSDRTLHLPKPGERKMTDSEWDINKSCEAKKRAHKWNWKFDIAAGVPSQTQAICAHCGREAFLTQGEMRVAPVRSE